jgi:hypothetical protein
MAPRDTASNEKKKAFIAAVDRALKNKRASRVDAGENTECEFTSSTSGALLIFEAPVSVANASRTTKKKQDATESQRVEYKLPYYSRRNQSKSEPSQGSHGSDEPDTDVADLTFATEGPASPVSLLITYRLILAHLSNATRCAVVLHYLL